MLYFAYGSNLCHSQMHARCPGAVFLSSATLYDYKLQFDGYSKKWNGAVANIVRDAGSKVAGGLYEVTPEHMATLDKHEGVHKKSYECCCVQITKQNGEQLEARVYLRLPQPVGEPATVYLDMIKQGWVDCGL